MTKTLNLIFMNSNLVYSDGGFSSVSCLGDSTCVISALEKNATAFNLFMHACLSEIHNLRNKISQKTHLEEVFHVASSDNVADICTRRETSLSNLGHDTVWLFGPPWLNLEIWKRSYHEALRCSELPITHNSTRVRMGLNQIISVYIFLNICQ